LLFSVQGAAASPPQVSPISPHSPSWRMVASAQPAAHAFE
jgi:hypothetical protein